MTAGSVMGYQRGFLSEKTATTKGTASAPAIATAAHTSARRTGALVRTRGGSPGVSLGSPACTGMSKGRSFVLSTLTLPPLQNPGSGDPPPRRAVPGSGSRQPQGVVKPCGGVSIDGISSRDSQTADAGGKCTPSPWRGSKPSTSAGHCGPSGHSFRAMSNRVTPPG